MLAALLTNGESPKFAIGYIPTIAYDVTFPSLARNRRVITIDVSHMLNILL